MLIYMYKLAIISLATVSLPPTIAYQILYLLRRGGDPPIRYRGRSHFGPHIAIDDILVGTYRGHMPKL